MSSSPGRLVAPGPSPDPSKEISTTRLLRECGLRLCRPDLNRDLRLREPFPAYVANDGLIGPDDSTRKLVTNSPAGLLLSITGVHRSNELPNRTARRVSIFPS